MTATPYADEAANVWHSGLGSPLPIPYGQKKAPPGGWTGSDAPYTSWPDVQVWLEHNGGDNIAVRVADGVVGMDVDAYKQGALETLSEFEDDYGTLARTVVSTSREDGDSGIRWYRVATCKQWPSSLGPGVEVIHPGHRYGVWKGSRHPDGGTYRLDDWRTGEGNVKTPKVDDLPYLTEQQQEGLLSRAKGAEAEAIAYSGPTWDELGEVERSILESCIPELVEERLQILREMATWPEGKVDELGRGWEKRTADVAQTFRTLLAEGWSGVDPDWLYQEYLKAAPGQRGTRADPVEKWRTQAGKPAVDGGRIANPVAGFMPLPDWMKAEPVETEPVDGALLLADVETFLGRFVAYPSEHARVAHTLWVAHTWFMDRWDSTPRIAFLSAEPGSGKSRALEVTEPLVPRPVHAVSVTPAYIFRKVSDDEGRPTLLYDEIDTVFGPKAKDNEDVRALLNAGHRKGATAGRCVIVGKKVETEELDSYCAVALAGLHDLPDTIATRSVIVRMRRRAPGEKVEPWRNRVNVPEGEAVGEQLKRWGESQRGAITWPKMPPEVQDRNADVWEALLAVADLAGGQWPERARAGAVHFVTGVETRGSEGVQLLADLREVFANADRLATAEVASRLNRLEDGQWSEANYGRGADGPWLAKMLRPYGVKPKAIRLPNGTTPRGYLEADLRDPWSRYL